MGVVFTLNRYFFNTTYPTTSAHPESVLILHPRETQNYVVTDATHNCTSISFFFLSSSGRGKIKL